MQLEARPGGRSRELDLPAVRRVAGVIARTDSDRGVWKAPAGLEAGIVGFTGLTEPHRRRRSPACSTPRASTCCARSPAAGPWSGARGRCKGDDALVLGVQVRADPAADRLHRQLAVPRHRSSPSSSPTIPTSGRSSGSRSARSCAGSSGRGRSSRARSAPSPTASSCICDETVNPQSEIDLGRVNVVVGFAPLKPAEFVIVITITQISQLEE